MKEKKNYSKLRMRLKKSNRQDSIVLAQLDITTNQNGYHHEKLHEDFAKLD